MFKNYLKLSLRNLWKHKAYSLINITGLSLGLAVAIVIFMYVRHELSYDRHHEHAETIFRLTSNYEGANGQSMFWVRYHDARINSLPEELPEVESLVRFHHLKGLLVEVEKERFYEDAFFKTDAWVFDVFSFNLVIGEPETALKEPHSIVVATSVARKYFGDENPIGKSIKVINDSGQDEVYQITGIFEDTPTTSHFGIKFLASFANEEERAGWAYIYLKLQDGVKTKTVEEKVQAIVRGHLDPAVADNVSSHLQALTDIHLTSHSDREIEPNGDSSTVHILILVAAFILLLALVNYVNMWTASSQKRHKEVGIRKVLGSGRWQIMQYFFIESVVITSVSFSLAMLLLILIMPAISNYLGKMLELSLIGDMGFLLQCFSLIIFIALIAGSYPSLVLSSFHPIVALKGSTENPKSKNAFVSLLVTLQFIFCIALGIGSLTFYKQFDYLQNKRLGFNKEHVVVLPDIPWHARTKSETFKNTLLSHASIQSVSAAMNKPTYALKATGHSSYEGGGDQQQILYIFAVDTNFINFMGIELLAGENFNHRPFDYSTIQYFMEEVNTAERTYIINESALQIFGWETPEEAIGKQIDWGNGLYQFQRGPISGVVKDFNYSSLRRTVSPMILVHEPLFLGSILIKTAPGDIQASISNISSAWEEMFPQYPLRYTFLDEMYAALYNNELKLKQMVTGFTAIAILIACLGVLGLASITTEQRTKEIAVRKIVGASVAGIIRLLCTSYVKWIVLANGVAWPFAYYALNKWLQNFAYRIGIEWWMFVLTGVSALVIALLTVSTQAIRAATANPVESLRYE